MFGLAAGPPVVTSFGIAALGVAALADRNPAKASTPTTAAAVLRNELTFEAKEAMNVSA
jgi:hypothetical protein